MKTISMIQIVLVQIELSGWLKHKKPTPPLATCARFGENAGICVVGVGVNNCIALLAFMRHAKWWRGFQFVTGIYLISNRMSRMCVKNISFHQKQLLIEHIECGWECVWRAGVVTLIDMTRNWPVECVANESPSYFVKFRMLIPCDIRYTRM